MPSVFISAAHKSSGKTTLSIGLCAALCASGLRLQPFKKGPDYIDPLWLSAASGQPCHNLDFNTMSHAEILQTLQCYGEDADLSLIEANKGLYDGVAVDGSDSNAALAKLIGSPVVLVLDTRGMTRGVAPLLLGYQLFDTEVAIDGVILNRTGGERHVAKLRRAVEEYTDVPVLGAVRESAEMEIEERHLGLMPCNERGGAEQQIVRMGELVGEQVDVERVLGNIYLSPQTDIVKGKENPLPSSALIKGGGTFKACTNETSTSIKIAIPQDSAFAFYYPGDLEALTAAGAELVPINTLSDAALPAAADALFIGGGFPETQMHQLSANESMRHSIRNAIEAGLPTYAECGGLMYLSRSISWHGERAEMVGIIPGDAVMYKKPQGRGYVKLQETSDMPWPGSDTTQTVNAHEFHYSLLEDLTASGRFAYRVLRGQGIDGTYDGWVYKNLLASYTHMRHTNQFPWAQRFVEYIKVQQASALQQASKESVNTERVLAR